MNYRRALIVGMNYYKSSELPNLDAAENDAREMVRVLEHHGDGRPNFDEIRSAVSIGTDIVTSETLLREFDLLVENSGGTDLLFYYSGHGANREFGLQLATAEKAGNYDVGVPFDVLMHRASREKFDSLTIVLDCCFSGAAANLGIGESLDVAWMRPNVTILGSSASSRESFADSDMSDYTRTLVRGFDGAAVTSRRQVTAFELHRLAMDQVDQTRNGPPVLKSHNCDSVELRLH